MVDVEIRFEPQDAVLLAVRISFLRLPWLVVRTRFGLHTRISLSIVLRVKSSFEAALAGGWNKVWLAYSPPSRNVAVVCWIKLRGSAGCMSYCRWLSKQSRACMHVHLEPQRNIRSRVKL